MKWGLLHKTADIHRGQSVARLRGNCCLVLVSDFGICHTHSSCIRDIGGDRYGRKTCLGSANSGGHKRDDRIIVFGFWSFWPNNEKTQLLTVKNLD